MNRNCLWLMVCMISFSASGQVVRGSVAGICTGLTAYSALQANAFSFGSNQAALVGVKKFSLGIYGERRFMLQELGLYKMSLVLPTASGNFGGNAGYYGNALYNESQLGLAYARKLGKLDAGVQFNYFGSAVSSYARTATVNVEGGLILHLTDQLQTGIHFYNPAHIQIGKNAEKKLPLVCSAGFGYDVSGKFFFAAEMEKTEDLPTTINAGLQYSFDDQLFARAGICSGTSSFYLGTGIRLGSIDIDLTASLHPQLGITPGLTLIYHSKDAR